MLGTSRADRQTTFAAAGAPAKSAPEFQLLLERLPADVLHTLTDVQRDAIASAMVKTARKHRVDYRVSVKWLRQRYYVRLMIGDEMRKLSRLQRERQLNLAATLLFLFFMVWLVVSVLIAFIILCTFGADLFDGLAN